MGAFELYKPQQWNTGYICHNLSVMQYGKAHLACCHTLLSILFENDDQSSAVSIRVILFQPMHDYGLPDQQHSACLMRNCQIMCVTHRDDARK